MLEGDIILSTGIFAFLPSFFICLSIGFFLGAYDIIHTFKRNASLAHIRENTPKAADWPHQR